MPGFFTRSPGGLDLHVNGDRNMSDETLAAIMEISELAMRQHLRRQLVRALIWRKYQLWEGAIRLEARL
jgi:hypothetical protein